MRTDAKRVSRALTLLVVLTVVALLLSSCAYEIGYRFGEIAEKARIKAMEILEEAFDGFKQGSGWFDGSGWFSSDRSERPFPTRPSDSSLRLEDY